MEYCLDIHALPELLCLWPLLNTKFTHHDRFLEGISRATRGVPVLYSHATCTLII